MSVPGVLLEESLRFAVTALLPISIRAVSEPTCFVDRARRLYWWMPAVTVELQFIRRSLSKTSAHSRRALLPAATAAELLRKIRAAGCGIATDSGGRRSPLIPP